MRLGGLPIVPGMLLAGLAATHAVQSAEPLFYFIDGEAIVFTNQRGHGVQPVPGFFETGAAGSKANLPETPYDPFIKQVARENDLAPELIKAVALVESGFNPHAVSHAGAQGLMQLMPATARDYGVRDPFDPLTNLQAGARHLRKLLDRFDGNLALALAAYNAGETAVLRYDGVPNYSETKDYVRKVHEKLGRRPPPGLGHGESAGATSPIRYRVLEDGSILLSNDD